MRDPFPFPPIPALAKASQSWADRLSFPTLPLHIHEVIGAAAFYTFVHVVVSPVVSNLFFSKYYPKHSRSKKANWDTHVVSLVQSTLINALALWVMYADKERSAMDFEQRIWGYTGASGMIQALACGYFVWDLGVTLLNFDIFGFGLLAHAVSALVVYSFGFRPFLNFYSTTFILYELSTPFLNIHWFCDKLNMTGSRVQLYNGVALLVTFFCCRLLWGTWQSAVVYKDMWQAVHRAPSPEYIQSYYNTISSIIDAENVMLFAAKPEPVPKWLALLYVASNVTLNTLNWYWFFKMVTAVRKRFVPKEEMETTTTKKEKLETVGSSAEKGAKANTTATEQRTKRPVAINKSRRTNSIKDLVPDNEELREGTIQ
ncbi:TLC domain-containing protein [Pseudoneurospora amorphoporcata]|uniref:TLC domain-containing protein n=1 Tax=Pseudoneurospora amorphoporcata TaxID=241081 RepID=A0AAN6SGA4_9PEZI|nr:TLC domain-containing protein [Pseudoneurospora amorphoporcata]